MRLSAHLCTTPTDASAAAASNASRFVTTSAVSAAEPVWEGARGTARAMGRWRAASAHGRADVKGVPRSTCCAGSAGDIMLLCQSRLSLSDVKAESASCKQLRSTLQG